LFLLPLYFHLVISFFFFFILMRNSRERSRDSNSIPKMSLKEEPAGAFNKAQRLIELRQHRQLLRIMQGANDQNAWRQATARDRQGGHGATTRSAAALIRIALPDAFSMQSRACSLAPRQVANHGRCRRDSDPFYWRRGLNTPA
jgi:hypothetical protein